MPKVLAPWVKLTTSPNGAILNSKKWSHFRYGFDELLIFVFDLAKTNICVVTITSNITRDGDCDRNGWKRN